MHAQTWPLRCAHNFLTEPLVPHTERRKILGSHGLLDGFAFLAVDVLSRITDTLTLVRLRGIIGTNIRGNLTNQLPIDALDLDFSVIGYRNLNSFRYRKENRMGETER